MPGYCHEAAYAFEAHESLVGGMQAAGSLAAHPEGSAEGELDRQILSYNQRFDIQTGLLNTQAIQQDLTAMLRNQAAGHDVALIWVDLVNLRREFSLWGWSGAEALARRVAS